MTTQTSLEELFPIGKEVVLKSNAKRYTRKVGKIIGYEKRGVKHPRFMLKLLVGNIELLACPGELEK